MAYVIGEDCIACGTCIDECPSGAISEGDKYSIDADACTECGTCASVCPSEAISLPE
jgi:ferredoxin